MANKMYKQVEMLAPVKEANHIATKGYVDSLLNARLQEGVACAIIENIEGTYDADTKTLTQTGGTVNSDGVTLVENMEVLLIAQNDKSQNGRYVVKVAPVDGSTTPSSVVANVTGTGITSATVDKTVFETKVTTSGTTTFTYDGVTDMAWKLDDGTQVTLSDYGIEEVLVGSDPADHDKIEVIYVQEVTTSGTMGKFVRSEKMNDSAQLFSGMMIPTHCGDAYSDAIFMLINDGAMTLDTTSLVFEKYKCTEEVATTYEGTFVGDDVATEFTITHGLGTQKVTVKVYDNVTNEEVGFGVKIVSDNAIEIQSDVVLAPTDEFKVVVQG